MQFRKEAVGAVIRRLRLKRSMSQEVASGFAGISRTHLTMIENGSKQPNLETLWKIAHAFDISASELVRQIEEETANTK